MKFSGKMCLMIITKVTKNHGFTLCLEDTIFEKKIDPPSRFRVKGCPVSNYVEIVLIYYWKLVKSISWQFLSSVRGIIIYIIVAEYIGRALIPY